MNTAPSALPCRWIFPIVQLLICAVVVWPVRNQLRFGRSVVFQFDVSSATSEPEPLIVYPFKNDFMPEDPAVIRSEKIAEMRLNVPVFLNLPAALFVLPYAILSPTKNDWVPRGMDFRT